MSPTDSQAAAFQRGQGPHGRHTHRERRVTVRTHGDNMAKVSLAEASRGRTRLERSPHSQPRCCFAVHTAAQPHAKRQRESRVARRTFPCSSSISSLLSPRCSFPRTGEYTAETRKGMKTMQNFVTYRRGRLQRTRGGARGRTQLQARGGEKERQNAPFPLSPLLPTFLLSFERMNVLRIDFPRHEIYGCEHDRGQAQGECETSCNA